MHKTHTWVFMQMEFNSESMRWKTHPCTFLIPAYLNRINLLFCSLWSIRNKHVAWVRLRPSSLSSSWVCCWLLHESSVGNLSLPIYTSVHTLHLVSLSLCLSLFRSHSLFEVLTCLFLHSSQPVKESVVIYVFLLLSHVIFSPWMKDSECVKA